MTDPLGVGAPPLPAPIVAPPAAASTGELTQPPPAALQLAANFAASVIGRGSDGAFLLRTAFGTLSLKTALALTPGTQLEMQMQPGTSTGVTILAAEEPAQNPAAASPPMRLDIGTTLDATVRLPAPGPAAADAPVIGTRLLLRVVAPQINPGTPTLAGTVALGAGGETVIETPIGTLALDMRIALPPGTEIAFEPLEQTPPMSAAAPPPTQSGGWPVFDRTLELLDRVAPDLARQLRYELTPNSGGALAGSLLFLVAALYQNRWPGGAVGDAMTASGNERLRQRLADDTAELQRLRDDPATGDWRVLILPFLAGAMVQPVRVYLRRRSAKDDAATPGGTRFVIEAELHRLGPLQFDGLQRGRRLDLVLRSHTPLPAELRAGATAIFHRATEEQGLHGDIGFATSAQFATAPLAQFSRHVEVRI